MNTSSVTRPVRTLSQRETDLPLLAVPLTFRNMDADAAVNNILSQAWAESATAYAVVVRSSR